MNRTPEAVVGAYVLDRRGRLLLVKSPKWKNDWMAPGGHVEYGETIYDCARREVLEETGLKVKPIGVLSIGEGLFPKEYRRKRHLIYIEVICRASSNKVRMDRREVVDFGWFTLNDAMRKTRNKAVRRVIRIYRDQANNGPVHFIDPD